MKKDKEEKQKELTFIGWVLTIFLLAFGLFTSSIYGIFYLIAYAGVGFIGYVIFEHYLGIGVIGAFITIAVCIFIHLWLDGAFDKEEDENKKPE